MFSLTRLKKLPISLAYEKQIEAQLIDSLSNDRVVKFGSINEFDLGITCFYFKKFFFLSSLNFLYPQTKFLNFCLRFLIQNRFSWKQQKIDTSRLFINLVAYCFKKKYSICFLGTHSIEEDQLKRTFQLMFPKLSDISFIDQVTIKQNPVEMIRFLNKSNYRLIVVASKMRHFYSLIDQLSKQTIFFDCEAMGVYGRQRDSLKKRRFCQIEMLKYIFLWWVVWARWILFLIPYRFLFFLSIVFLKLVRGKSV